MSAGDWSRDLPTVGVLAFIPFTHYRRPTVCTVEGENPMPVSEQFADVQAEGASASLESSESVPVASPAVPKPMTAEEQARHALTHPTPKVRQVGTTKAATFLVETDLQI